MFKFSKVITTESYEHPKNFRAIVNELLDDFPIDFPSIHVALSETM